MNGYLFCNMPDIIVPEGTKLRLILIGVGGATDMHTPGFTNLVQNTPSGGSYVVELYPGQARVVGMYAGARRSLLPGLFGVIKNTTIVSYKLPLNESACKQEGTPSHRLSA